MGSIFAIVLIVGGVSLAAWAKWKKQPPSTRAAAVGMPSARVSAPAVPASGTVRATKGVLLFNKERKAYRVKSLAANHAIAASFDGSKNPRLAVREFISTAGNVFLRPPRKGSPARWASASPELESTRAFSDTEINPSTGLPMVDGIGSLDSSGNAYGTGSMFGED